MISNEPRWNSPNWFDMSVVKYKLVPEVDGGCNRQPFSGSSQPASENPCITPDRHYSDQNVKTCTPDFRPLTLTKIWSLLQIISFCFRTHWLQKLHVWAEIAKSKKVMSSCISLSMQFYVKEGHLIARLFKWKLVTFKTNDARSEFTKQVQFNSKGIEKFLSWPWAKEKNILVALSRP